MSKKMYKITLCGSEAHNEVKMELNNVEAAAAEKIFNELRTEGTKDEYAPMPYIEEIAVKEEVPEGQLTFEEVYPELFQK